jgi:hypothetical protein
MQQHTLPTAKHEKLSVPSRISQSTTRTRRPPVPIAPVRWSYRPRFCWIRRSNDLNRKSVPWVEVDDRLVNPSPSVPCRRHVLCSVKQLTSTAFRRTSCEDSGEPRRIGARIASQPQRTSDRRRRRRAPDREVEATISSQNRRDLEFCDEYTMFRSIKPGGFTKKSLTGSPTSAYNASLHLAQHGVAAVFSAISAGRSVAPHR